MKVGDLVTMPGPRGPGPVGLIVQDKEDPRKSWSGRAKTRRVAVLWSDGDGAVDWEPRMWLKVLT